VVLGGAGRSAAELEGSAGAGGAGGGKRTGAMTSRQGTTASSQAGSGGDKGGGGGGGSSYLNRAEAQAAMQVRVSLLVACSLPHQRTSLECRSCNNISLLAHELHMGIADILTGARLRWSVSNRLDTPETALQRHWQ
jgi:hypothetical protein